MYIYIISNFIFFRYIIIYIIIILFQSQSTHKLRNTIYIEKNINQNKLKKSSTTSIINSPSQEPSPFLNSEITENVFSKSKRLSNVDSEIVKESICKSDTNMSGIGRGRGKSMHDVYSGLKKAKRTSGSESSETNNVQNTSLQTSYSQVTKKKVENVRKLDVTDNH